jgi:hypothetical protein
MSQQVRGSRTGGTLRGDVWHRHYAAKLAAALAVPWQWAGG